MRIFDEIVRTHPFLQGVPADYLARIIERAVVVEFAAGEIVFREGEYADKFYLIHRGSVALECHAPEGDIVIQTLKADEVMGWSWLFPPFTWHLQAKVVEPAIAMQINGASLLIKSEEDPKFGHFLMKRLAQILIHRLQETRHHLLELQPKPRIEVGMI